MEIQIKYTLFNEATKTWKRYHLIINDNNPEGMVSTIHSQTSVIIPQNSKSRFANRVEICYLDYDFWRIS